ENKVYTREFKLYVLRFRQENMLSYRETASHFKISNSAMICAWQRIFEEKGILGLATIGKDVQIKWIKNIRK
ncbi:transposase, partial [Staphylococcus saprophyticus]|nr:transposase [Staphylococcus saprophyticus]